MNNTDKLLECRIVLLFVSHMVPLPVLTAWILRTGRFCYYVGHASQTHLKEACQIIMDLLEYWRQQTVAGGRQ